MFGLVIGASVESPWPARPIVVGRWGWADPGDVDGGPSMMGNHRYDPGEKLGDLVLAAEQPFGKGKVVVFGDTSGLTNGLTIGCHPYTSRLYAYVADGPSTPRATWRQMTGLLGLVLLVVLILWRRPEPWRVAAPVIVLSSSVMLCTELTHRTWEIMPDGNMASPNNLAYIDASHCGAYAAEGWRGDGTMGLSLALLRNGYLSLMLPELTRQRLDRARLLICVAPTRPFSKHERQIVKDFVWEGGVFICTVGYERSGPSRSLLSELGFHVGGPPGERDEGSREPKPLGHFKSPYFNGGNYLRYVRFHAAWPVTCDDPEALVVAYYPPDVPLIVVRRFGEGLVAVIGDTCFAMNKNLEHEDGAPIEGKRENSDFWRYFLSLLAEGVGDRQEIWYPPKPEEAP